MYCSQFIWPNLGTRPISNLKEYSSSSIIANKDQVWGFLFLVIEHFKKKMDMEESDKRAQFNS